MPAIYSRRLADRVALALDLIRPALVADGCNIELTGVDEEGVVRITLQGRCDASPGLRIALRTGVEVALQEAVPEIAGVVVG